VTAAELWIVLAAIFALMATCRAFNAQEHSARMRARRGRPSRVNWVPCVYWTAMTALALWKAFA
jgi:hypothetical protein